MKRMHSCRMIHNDIKLIAYTWAYILSLGATQSVTMVDVLVCCCLNEQIKSYTHTLTRKHTSIYEYVDTHSWQKAVQTHTFEAIT